MIGQALPLLLECGALLVALDEFFVGEFLAPERAMHANTREEVRILPSLITSASTLGAAEHYIEHARHGAEFDRCVVVDREEVT